MPGRIQDYLDRLSPSAPFTLTLASFSLYNVANIDWPIEALVGIAGLLAGLLAGVDFVLTQGVDRIRAHEIALADRLIAVLDKVFQIATRAGLHCAPQAHHIAGTLETGALRFSPGIFTTAAEIEYTVDALAQAL